MPSWPVYMNNVQSGLKPLCLNTRPAHQSHSLSSSLQQQGFRVVEFPTIEIRASANRDQLEHLPTHITDYDIALFVSRNAVDYAFSFFSLSDLPAQMQLGVIGKGSWQALSEQGVQSQIIPATSYDSEGLLAAENLQQVGGKKIIIFRGQAGRNLLGDTLRARGARVDYYEVYRRVVPEYPENFFSEQVGDQFPDVAIFTSAEGLQNCFQLLQTQQLQQLKQIPWVLISERMRETAHNLGHNGAIIIARNASDQGILQALQDWHNTRL